jgi:xylose isomerase
MGKLAIITVFLAQTRNRFLQYQQPRSIAEVLALAGRAAGCDGVELRYPVDFADVDLLKRELALHNLGVAAVNFASVRNDRWLRGAWTSPDPAERRDAVDDFKRCIDVASAIGAPRITNCPLNDGVDFPFELDFAQAFDQAAGCYDQVAAHNPAMQICIEYKASEPRVRSLLGTAGETAAFCQLVDRDNLGVTLDVGHALFAQENCAQSAALLAKAKRLFYVHLNDNDGRADWDLLPGSVHLWDLVEFFYTLRRVGYDDWFTFDATPKEQDPAEFFSAAVKLTRKIEDISRRVDPQKLTEYQEYRNAAKTGEYLYSLI